VTGFDTDAEALACAVERGAIDESAASVEEAVRGAELAVVAVPVASLARQVEEVVAAGGDATVTDVGSTKGAVVAAAAGEARFIGGHPVCGSEAHGPRECERRALPGRDLVPHPGGRDRRR